MRRGTRVQSGYLFRESSFNLACLFLTSDTLSHLALNSIYVLNFKSKNQTTEGYADFGTSKNPLYAKFVLVGL